jgi:hypothetical protein
MLTATNHRGKNTRSKGKQARLTLSAKTQTQTQHERKVSVEHVVAAGPFVKGGVLSSSSSSSSSKKTVVMQHTQRTGSEQKATLSLELPGGQELLTLRIACPS